MICVSLKGRMCNQMFQMAAAKALSLDNNTGFVCSNIISGITPTNLETKKHRMTIFNQIDFTNFSTNNRSFHDDSGDFSYKQIDYRENLCLTGYYQSEMYFKHRAEDITSLFKCPEKIEKFLFKKFQKILDNKETCAVHVRRGDYLKYKDFHNNLGTSYYSACFEEMNQKHLVFFSDDIQWCRENFKNLNASFINTGSDVIDFYLMSKMQNNVIANSSFSWWAAWLNQNKNKTVLAPKN